MKVESNSNSYSVICEASKLKPDTILKEMSIMKGRLMLGCINKPLKKIQCFMTPAVRQILVTANKRLAMYGKTRPHIVHFDEFGNRLSDKITIGSDTGITLKIVDPSSYGEHYLEIKAIYANNK